MKNTLSWLMIIFFFGISQAQVGIGTTTPDGSSILDISSTDKGVLIPRMTQSQRNSIGSPIEGLFIYQIDNTPGFYFYDGSGWNNISNSDDADWFQVGTITAPAAITDDIFTQGNVAIGKNTADSPLDIEVMGSPTNLIAMKMIDNSGGTGDHIGMQQTLGGTHNESIKGIETYITNTGSRLHTGINISVANGSGAQIGNRTTINGETGLNTVFSGSIFDSGTASSTTQTGLGLSVQQPSSQITYGVISTLNSSGVGASGTKYGAYNLLDGGSGLHYGIYNDIRGLNNNTKYGTYNRFGIGTIDTGGELYGTYNSFGTSITSTTNKYGNYTEIPAGLAGNHYGTYNDVQNAAGYAGYFIGRVSFGNTTSNRYTLPAAEGTLGQVITADGSGGTNWTTVGGSSTSIAQASIAASSQTITGTQKIVFNSETIDTNNEFDTVNQRFTAAQAGYYKVDLGVYLTSHPGGSFAIHIFKNDASIERDIFYNGPGFNSISGTCIVQLAAGEFVDAYATQVTGSSSISGDPQYTYFEIHRID